MINKMGFAQNLVDEVLSGEKTITYRLGEKYADNLELGAIIDAINSQTETSFCKIKIKSLAKMPIADVPLDQDGHEKYNSVQDLVISMQKHYVDKKITPQSIVSYIEFELV